MSSIAADQSPPYTPARAAEDGDLFENAFDHAPIGMALVSLDGRFMKINDAFCRMVGYSPADLLACDFQTITHPDDLDIDLGLLGQLTAGEIPHYQMDKRYIRADGAQVWAHLSASMVSDGEGRPKHFIAQVQDLTVRMAQEEALAQAIAAAEAAAAAKAEFLANMSHEIRTPLTAVIGFSGLLADRPGLDERARNYVELISTAGRSLLAIVNDILDFSKLEAGQYGILPQPTSPIDAARDALTMFTPQAKAKGLDLRFVQEGEVPACVGVDPERLRQVLANLIGNAVKFTAEGSVTVYVGHEDGLLYVRVDDTGQGLDPAQQAKLFQRFSQVDASSTRRHGGTGLGLAICKGIVEAMGGAIGVISRPGRGASFHFHIQAPAVEAVAAPPVAAPLDGGGLEGLKVLVVDDNATNRQLARVILQAVGVVVSEAADGHAATAQARADAFDVILMDVRMPGLDGPQTMRLIRSQEGPSRTARILGFSANANTLAPGEDGFDGFVRKPLVAATLIAAVAQAAIAAPAPTPAARLAG